MKTPGIQWFKYASPQNFYFLAGKLWPDQPTLQNFQIVFTQQHYYLHNFWRQMFNSFFIAISTGLITLFVATTAAFVVGMFFALRRNDWHIPSWRELRGVPEPIPVDPEEG